MLNVKVYTPISTMFLAARLAFTFCLIILVLYVCHNNLCPRWSSHTIFHEPSCHGNDHHIVKVTWLTSAVIGYQG
jgi:hypothetical protein